MNGTAQLSLVPPMDAPTGLRMSALHPELHPELHGQPRASGLRLAPTAPTAPTVGLRLTRRGRLVLLTAFLSALLTAGVLFGYSTSRASGEAAPPREYRYVVVQPGETLWGIARSAAPAVDPRITIERIRDLNALSSTAVQAGQRIALP